MINDYMLKWYSSPSFYEYDPTRDLYEQINEHINNKLIWYDELLHTEFYSYDNWKDLTIDLRYAKITTIVNPQIERDIYETDDAEATFRRIMWHVPYFIWRDPNTDNVIKQYQHRPEIIPDVVNDCNQVLLKREWKTDTIFSYIGNTKLDEINININKNKLTVVCDEPFTFEYINDEYVSDINSLSASDNNLLIAKLYFNGNTITDASNLFSNCQSLQYADLSNFNMNYCDDLSMMFNNCTKLRKIDISNLDLDIHDPKITNMFINCLSLHTVIMKNCTQSTIDQIKCVLRSCGIDTNKINFMV